MNTRQQGTLKTAVTIWSGGIDSTCMLYALLNDIYISQVYPVHFNYGQKQNKMEYNAIMEIVSALGSSLESRVKEITVDPSIFESSLVIPELEVPDVTKDPPPFDSPDSTTVLFRNPIFISMAVAYASSIHADMVAIGIVKPRDEDPHNRYDNNENFVNVMKVVVQAGTNGKVDLIAPFVSTYKRDVVKFGSENHVPLHRTYSCYRGEELHCGSCRACMDRKNAFKEAGLIDSTHYATTTS